MDSAAVYMIDAFEGPRHDRLRAIWDRWAAAHPEIPLHVFPNPGAKRPHWRMLDAMWAHANGGSFNESVDPARYLIFTERDFLPAPMFATTPTFGFGIVAAEYCTRDPITRGVIPQGIPGAWYILFDREALDGWEPNFAPSGRFNDPANGMFDGLPSALRTLLIPPTDCWPDHWGVRVGARGEHLFWSRHYNDPPEMRVAGFALGDIQRKIDSAIDKYERGAGRPTAQVC